MKFHFRQASCPTFEEGPKTLRESILEDLEKTRYELETAYLGFDYVTDPDLIDCYIYEVNSIMKRYRYLLNQAASLSPLPEEDILLSNPESPVGALVG
ncbi:MAG: YaaL family protein [Lachnospiraceae bacterium]|nr:YaaL family protein [Lachnospiraceae bacterium]